LGEISKENQKHLRKTFRNNSKKQFNIELLEHKELTEKLSKLFSKNEKIILIEIFLNRGNQRILLERWKIQRESNKEEDQKGSIAKCFLIMRALFSINLVMPAYQIHKKISKGFLPNFNISYSISSASDEAFEFETIKNQFEKIQRQKVSLKVDVEYIHVESILRFIKASSMRTKSLWFEKSDPLFSLTTEEAQENDLLEISQEFIPPFMIDQKPEIQERPMFHLNLKNSKDSWNDETEPLEHPNIFVPPIGQFQLESSQEEENSDQQETINSTIPFLFSKNDEKDSIFSLLKNNSELSSFKTCGHYLVWNFILIKFFRFQRMFWKLFHFTLEMKQDKK
jgi:hypothetical protein